MNPAFVNHAFEVETPNRLDKAITDVLSDLSRGKAQATIANAWVRVNGE